MLIFLDALRGQQKSIIILLCINKQIPSKLICKHTQLELLTVEIYTTPIVTLCLIYRPPNTSDESELHLHSYLQGLAKTDNLIILGDFNYSDINWLSLSANQVSSNQFVDLLFREDLTQLVLSSTHCKGNILDLVITNTEDSTSNLWIDSNSNHSDHFPVHLSVVRPLPGKKPKAGAILIPNYNKANFEDMCNFLLDHDFSEFYESDNIDDLWFYLKNTITDAVDKFVPTVRISNNNFPKWFTPDIKHHINKLRYFRRKDRFKSTTQSKSKIRLEEELSSQKYLKLGHAGRRN